MRSNGPPAIMLGRAVRGNAPAGRNAWPPTFHLLLIRKELPTRRTRLAPGLPLRSGETQRISLLIDERQKKQVDTEKASEAERQRIDRACPPGRQSQKDLIERFEQGLRYRQPRRTVGDRAPEETAKDKRSEHGPGPSWCRALQDPGDGSGDRFCVSLDNYRTSGYGKQPGSRIRRLGPAGRLRKGPGYCYEGGSPSGTV